MLGELIVDPPDFRLLGGHRSRSLRDRLLPWAGLRKRERRPCSCEERLRLGEFGLGDEQLVFRARATLGQPRQPCDTVAGIVDPGGRSGDGGPRLIELLRPASGPEFGEYLRPAFQFRGGTRPLDLEEPPQQFGDWLAGGDPLPVLDRHPHHAPVHGAAHVADASGVDRAHE